MRHIKYSQFFETLHDEQEPVGKIGDGAHYSILSAVQFRTPDLKTFHQPRFQKFALIWDTDHDERIINILEVAYMSGILSGVKYIGERKGHVTVIFDAEVALLSDEGIRKLTGQWDDICQAGFANDVWTFSYYFSFDVEKTGIIFEKKEKVSKYLDFIDELWNLGFSIYRPTNYLDINNIPESIKDSVMRRPRP